MRWLEKMQIDYRYLNVCIQTLVMTRDKHVMEIE